jgi:diphthamide synthase (EF-2-diphthine--ammonia ligase)
MGRGNDSGPTLLSWSTGKDCAWALHLLRQSGTNVTGLLTTFNEAFNRVAMHSTRRDVAEAQARALGLPLWPVDLPWPCSNEAYERIMSDVMSRARAEGVTHIAFGDLYLEDVRRYREERLAPTGIRPLFPLWTTSKQTAALAREMLDSGLRARVTSVDPKQLDA